MCFELESIYTSWLNVLKEVRLFEGIEIDELPVMLDCLSPSINKYKKKEYITIGGEKFTGIGVVISGEVVVTKENLSGDRIIMAKLKERDLFGEIIAFSDNDKWPATIIAETDAVVLFFPPGKIIGNCPNMCTSHRILIQNMLKIVSQKALNLNKKIEYLSMKSIRAKISSYLLNQYKISQNTSFTIPLNRNELSEFLNVSRPSLSREMLKMKSERIIDFNKSEFRIIEVEALKNAI